VNTLWKAVENSGAACFPLQASADSSTRFFHKGESAGPPLSACSACAGDYEDPDRTAGRLHEAEDDESNGAPSAATRRVPAEK
jgi:hypothetical protein